MRKRQLALFQVRAISRMQDGSPERAAHLRVLTFDSTVCEPSPEQGCDGTMTCECRDCSDDRRRRVVRGVQAPKGDPLKPRTARRAA